MNTDQKASYIRRQLETRGFMLTDSAEFCIKVALEDMEIGAPKHVCPRCNGYGNVETALGDPEGVTCPTCDGTGDCLHKNTRPFGAQSSLCDDCQTIIYAGHRYI